MGVQIKEFEYNIIKDLIEEGALLVTNHSNPRTFYVRFRAIVNEKGIGQFIKGAVRPEGIYLWLYPRYTFGFLHPSIIEAAKKVEVVDQVMSEETRDKMLQQIRSLFFSGDDLQWVKDLNSLHLPTPILGMVKGMLFKVMKGEGEQEFLEFVEGGTLPEDVKSSLRKILEEVVK